MTFESILETFWHLLVPLGLQPGFRSMFIFYEFSLIFRGYPQIPGEQILEGKVWFGTPTPQNPDYRQLTSDLQSALTCEGKGNRQQK